MILALFSWTFCIIIVLLILLKYSRKLQQGFNVFLGKYIFTYHLILPTENILIPQDDQQKLLILGSIKAATNFNLLKHFNIKYVLSVGQEFANFTYPEKLHIKHKIILAQDLPDYPIKDDFIEATHFIKKGFEKNRCVLIHCKAGISRSSTIVIAFLMLHYKLKLLDAYNIVHQKRVYISPNQGFIKQLIALQKFLEKCQYYGNQSLLQ